MVDGRRRAEPPEVGGRGGGRGGDHVLGDLLDLALADELLVDGDAAVQWLVRPVGAGRRPGGAPLGRLQSRVDHIVGVALGDAGHVLRLLLLDLVAEVERRDLLEPLHLEQLGDAQQLRQVILENVYLTVVHELDQVL